MTTPKKAWFKEPYYLVGISSGLLGGVLLLPALAQSWAAAKHEIAVSQRPAAIVPLKPSVSIKHYKGTIVLDAGHGGAIPHSNGTTANDSGAVGCFPSGWTGNVCKGIEIYESDIALGQAQEIKAGLEKRGYRVIMTRDVQWTGHLDRVPGTNLATPMALDRTSHHGDPADGNELYVALHLDSNPKNKWEPMQGPRINYSSCGDVVDKKFAEKIARAAKGAAWPNNRGIAVLQRTYQASVKGGRRPAVLVESVDLQNLEELAFINNPAKRSELNARLVDAIDQAMMDKDLWKMARGQAVSLPDRCQTTGDQDASSKTAPDNPTVSDSETADARKTNMLLALSANSDQRQTEAERPDTDNRILVSADDMVPK